ncbi:MAG: hypothetical protein QXS24_04640 [Desulfurococcaceae archaeon]
MNYKSIISTLVLIALVLPLVTPLLQILPVVTAQVNPEITNIYGGIFVEELGTISVYPGSTITVEVFTPYVTMFTIRVVNTFNTSIVYATQSFRPAEPGYVNVTLVLPKELPGLTRAAGILNVLLILGTTVVDSKLLSVLPMIEVTPSVTTIVDARGNPLNVTATVYGVPTNITVTSILINSYTIPVNLPADDKGVVTTTINLLGITGRGIPAGDYTVNFTTEAYEVPPEYFGTTTLTIRPQVVINPGAEPAGHGIYIYTPGADIGNDTITVVGYGFPADTSVTRIRLWNLNFTNVYYDFPLTNVSTDDYGYFNVSDLLSVSPTNMTAGLYIPIVYLAPNQSEIAYEFRNAYYLVRPILLFLVDGTLYRSYPGVVMPGASITIVAFGYSPGYYWYNVPNVLVVTLDKITPLWSGEVGKDGNVTFVVTIPKDTTWGAHYIHGIDSRMYEYSVAIVIGAKAVFIVELRPETNKVSASYYDTHIDACPCAVYEGKTFCDVCVVYTGDCDYIGDYVRVTVYGLQPGETLLKVYLGANEVRSDLWFPSAPVADAQGILTFKFLVPSIPQGTYVVRIVTSVAGEIIAVWEKNTTINYVEVVPKLLLVTLDSNLTSGRAILPILVGSGIVRVIGTGFKPGITMDTVIVNMTDAMRMILANVRYWSVNEKGILVGGKFAGQDIYPAILFPVMQPGKYEIRLGYYDGATPLLSDPGFIYVVNNLTFVATVNDVNKVITTVNTGLSNMQTFINTTMTQLANQINTALGTLASKSDIDKVLTAISDVKSAVVSVNSTVAAVGSKVDTAVTTINSALASVRSDLSGSILAVAGKVDAILDKVTVIYDNVTMIGIKIEKLDNVVTKLDSLASQLAGAVNSINALSSKLDDLSRKVDAATSDVKTAVANVGNAVNAVSGKVDAVSSKVDNVGGTATNGMYVGVLALVFALLAMIFALLAYNTIRKSVAPK